MPFNEFANKVDLDQAAPVGVASSGSICLLTEISLISLLTHLGKHIFCFTLKKEN